ncbi:hypothetical protein ABZX40_41355 [Streptomyces sp. NPDC004610]|uniref:hypothetical protein n=1 Tax=unclassified Streptomyces TaxID=2593676 RepID=UPI0033BB8D32
MVKMPPRERLLPGLEVAFVVLFLAGVAMLWVPAALMVGGVLGVLAVEREMARPGTAQPRGKGAR